MTDKKKEVDVSGPAKVLVMIGAFAFAIPAAAQTPASTTAFDGKYGGASAHVSKSTAHGRQCPREHAPDPLTINNGAVHSKEGDRWTGTVNPQGALTIRTKRSMRIDAQIDPQGTIKGRYNGPACMVDYVWHRQS
jgi:hypothetical protein